MVWKPVTKCLIEAFEFRFFGGELNVASKYMDVLNDVTSGAAAFHSACWHSIRCSSSAAWKGKKSSANSGVPVVWLKHIFLAMCCRLLLQRPLLQTMTMM